MIRILFLRSNPIDPDPRVEKEALALKKAGYSIVVLGWDRSASLPIIQEKEYGIIERLPIAGKFGSGMANLPSLLKFQIELIKYLWKNRKNYSIIHACDFDTILPALIAKIILRKKVVYDIFDFYADMIKNIPNWIRKIIRYMDIKAIELADAVILADESRINQISGAKPRNLIFVYNSPEITSLPKLPPLHPPYRVGYVGLLDTSRGLITMIDAIKDLSDWILELAGFGGDEEKILIKAKSFNNIRFYGRIPYEKALAIYESSHVLFATYDPRIPNHRFSSPNKVFEAMALGRPIIVAKGMGIDRLVEKYGLGFVVEYGNVEQYKSVLKEISQWDEKTWRSFIEHAHKVYKSKYAWEIQAERLLQLYDKLARRKSNER